MRDVDDEIASGTRRGTAEIGHEGLSASGGDNQAAVFTDPVSCGSCRMLDRDASVVQMFVLGIDPGLTRCGFAVLEPTSAGRSVARSIGVLRTDKDDTTPNRLAELNRELHALLDEFKPEVVAIERIFFQNNAQSFLGVAQAAGLVLTAAAERRLVIEEYSPNQIKAAVAGDGRADKLAMQTMVKTLLGLSSMPKPADAADAAAIALCYLAHNPVGRFPVGSPR